MMEWWSGGVMGLNDNGNDRDRGRPLLDKRPVQPTQKSRAAD